MQLSSCKAIAKRLQTKRQEPLSILFLKKRVQRNDQNMLKKVLKIRKKLLKYP